jgi:hypothetical protein
MAERTCLLYGERKQWTLGRDKTRDGERLKWIIQTKQNEKEGRQENPIEQNGCFRFQQHVCSYHLMKTRHIK